jgi:pimeloyl-ACP methyl ester carboxylesterase
LTASTDESIIFEDEHITVFVSRGTSSTVLLLFGEVGHSGARFSWGGRTVSQLGHSYLGFVSKTPNWFPSSSMTECLRLQKNWLLQFDEIIMYGHSQGGYAALRYADEAAATAVLAVCPQFSIDPSEMEGKDKRFHDHFQGRNHHRGIKSEDVKADVKAFVIFDPRHRLDVLNIKYIEAVIPHLQKIRVYGTGHQTIRAIAGSRPLDEILKAVISNSYLKVYRAIRKAKRQWSLRELYLVPVLIERNAAKAFRLLTKNAHALNAEIGSRIADALISVGRTDLLSTSANTLLPHLRPSHMKVVLQAYLMNEDWRSYVELADRVEYLHNLDLLAHGLPRVIFEQAEPTSKKAIFGQGWHKRESDGRWSCALKSRICIDTTQFGPGCKTLRLRLGLIHREAQTLTVTAHHAQGCIKLDALSGFIDVPCEWPRVVLDIEVDELFSPKQLKLNSDMRLLGVRVQDTSAWQCISV